MNFFQENEHYAMYILIGFFFVLFLVKLFSKGNKLLKIEVSTIDGDTYFIDDTILNRKINVSKEWVWIVLLYPIRTIYICQNNPINLSSKALLLSLLDEISSKDWSTYEDVENIVGEKKLSSKNRGGKKIVSTLHFNSTTKRELLSKLPFQRFDTQLADSYAAILLTAVCRMNDKDKNICKRALKYLWDKYKHLDTTDPKTLYLPKEAFEAVHNS